MSSATLPSGPPASIEPREYPNRQPSSQVLNMRNVRPSSIAQPLTRTLLLLAALTSGALACSNNTSLGARVADRPCELTECLRPRYVVGEEMPRYSLEDRMSFYGVPGVAIAVIEDGEVVSVRGFGTKEAGAQDPVDAETVFSLGSVSKVLTAAIALRLHAQGKLDIDAPVEEYLSSWTLPEQETAPESKVTLRMILSHTAGFNVHGFGDFQPGEELPTVLDTLNGEAPAKNEALAFLFEPGTTFKYSGGGYTLAQLVISEVTGMSFQEAARSILFEPLGLSRSTFENPLPASHGNIARAHDREGQRAALPRGWEAMPEMAASGAWLSAADLGRFIAELIGSYRGDGGFLPRELAADMMTKVAPSQHGLGPRLDGSGQDFIFHHGGANNSYRAWVEGHLATGDGLVVLTNGTRGSGLYTEIRNAVADASGWRINRPVHLPELAPATEALDRLTGLYRPDAAFPRALRQNAVGWFFDQDLRLTRDGEKLVLNPADEPGREDGFELIPTAPGRFLLPLSWQRVGIAELVFHRGAGGRAEAMTLEMGNAVSHYDRVPD